MLRSEGVDLILNDQRRAFSEAYVNLLLTTCESYVEVSARSPLAQLPQITPAELKTFPAFWWLLRHREKRNRNTIRRSWDFRGNFCMRKPWRRPG